MAGVFSIIDYFDTKRRSRLQLQQKGSFVMDRELKVQMDANLENQGLARAVAAAYVSQADPTVEELTEVKTAVSEAFSNAAIHGYENRGRHS